MKIFTPKSEEVTTPDKLTKEENTPGSHGEESNKSNK